ncbi:tail assembly chaperone [Klebsiella sp. WP7-S18-CRE-02]|uniref:tail fiber assembly protein n=1 Tax=unclassified Klebsiella TaxID=2608929 RepID=UPI0015DBF5D7|nr:MULTISPECIES: tail fiber assembly protein [unclassified Klebsiella]BBS91716.1 tail assembly chaperone [Klebsiella sp. WP7-S18-CRE-02]BBS96738.1 tail assembly chaperone [Klebsiella sp. WP7-S18-CRE-03]BBT01770.1 tail assembly chaperone [Klebsiella sp. WP7-S18-ESBL-04]
MNQYKYSASQNLRYLISLIPFYSDQSALPDDMVDISDDMAAEFFDNPAPDGKVRAAGEDGLPCWVDAPEVSHDELVAQAENKRSVLRIRSESEIEWRQDAVDAEIATEDEATALFEWKKYRVLLMRVDTSKAPDIEWPTLPV